MAKLVLLLALIAGIWLLWRRGSRRTRAAMVDLAEARALLGVDDKATLEDIQKAHRRLIARVHPDTGGSAELATRVNDARDALVEELRRRTIRSS